MQFTLPVSKFAVELFEYIPQRVFEKYQEMIAKNVKIDMADVNVTIDRIAEELGADRAKNIQDAEDGQRELLMDEARREILSRHIKAEINLADTNTAEREKVVGMIKEMKDGETVLDASDSVPDLPRRDFAFLQKKVAEIEAKDEEEAKKSVGQSEE